MEKRDLKAVSPLTMGYGFVTCLYLCPQMHPTHHLPPPCTMRNRVDLAIRAATVGAGVVGLIVFVIFKVI